MAFRVKDLTISLEAAAAANIGVLQCPLHTIKVCSPCTYHYPTFCGHCTYFITQIPCYHGTVVCPTGSVITITDPTIYTDPVTQANPAVLKEQLQQALKSLEAAEQGAKPQTLADVEMLEKKMTEALEELRAQKAEFQKKK